MVKSTNCEPCGCLRENEGGMMHRNLYSTKASSPVTDKQAIAHQTWQWLDDSTKPQIKKTLTQTNMSPKGKRPNHTGLDTRAIMPVGDTGECPSEEA